MARRSSPPPSPVPPTLTPQQAVELIRRQLGGIDALGRLRFDDPEVKKWVVTTENILHAAFGKPDGYAHENASRFIDAQPIQRWHESVTDEDMRKSHLRSMSTRKALLESLVEQLLILAPPAAQTAPDQYRFHPEIERVSGQLYRDGHYKQAALEAYIRVIEEVRGRSGLNDGGDSLMNHAFGCDKQTPVIQFNNLQTDAERDEQKGFMFLFKGIVGLRNSKAHSNRLFDDPYQAHDYLALASLLMRTLEIATINRP